MFKKKLFLFLSIISITLPSFAQETKPTYRPFRYETPCGLETKTEFFEDTCIVIETRESGGALRTRNIFSNRFSLTIKGRFDKEKGYMTWDSHNKYEYKWEYKFGGNSVNGLGDWTYVMPGVLLQNISWD
jgi:hypothetical protein